MKHQPSVLPVPRGLSLGVALSSLLLSSGVAAQQMAITGATIIDGTGKAPVSDAVVLISDGRIAAIGRSREAAIPKGVRRLDARGKYVIPGLMDANMSVGFVGDLETSIKYDGGNHELVLEAAQIALKSGLTTVFSAFGPRAVQVKARDLINAGEAPGSRIYLAGNIIGFDGPVSTDFRGGEWSSHLSKALVDHINEMTEQGTGRELLWMAPEEVRSVIREYAQKVDYLKYGASGHWRDVAGFIAFSPRVQKVIVEEGHRASLIVQAHTMSIESLDLAIEAGVDIATHCHTTGPRTIPEETIKKLIERRIPCSIIPNTQRRLDALARARAQLNKLNTAIVSESSRDIDRINQRNLIKAGVTLLIATDAWLVSESFPWVAKSPTLAADTVDWPWKLGEGHFHALVALEEMGMRPMEILKSATSNIARAYKLDAALGTLEPGKIADLLILDANPLESARNYRRIHAVIKDGRVVDRDVLPAAPIITARKKLARQRNNAR